jgi:two-component system response regulator HydG
MRAHLFIAAGPNSGETYALGEAPLIVGRGKDCGIVLRDPWVSRRHFKVERREGAYRVVDLGSANRTSVNGLPTTEKALVDGDAIAIGSTRILFVVGARRLPTPDPDYEQTSTERLMRPSPPAEMVGSAPAMMRVFDLVRKAAPLDATVLVTGESGTGKELVARAIHRLGPRAGGPLVTVNCAAIPRDLIESELFGHERGAFTGAQAQRLGKFELATRGTLFLDEVGELPLEGQAKLLRVLEERRITRVGGHKDLDVDVRVVAATHRDLHAMVADGRFRLDLVYRLEVVTIALPPLRERRDDIVPLARHFLAHYREKLGHAPLDFAPGALERLREHRWPGNVRELKNAVERAAIFATGPHIGAGDIQLSRESAPPAGPPAPADAAAPTRRLEAPSPDGPLPPAKDGPVTPIDDVLRAQVERALAAAGGNKKRAAEMLGIPRSSLYGYIERFGLGREG